LKPIKNGENLIAVFSKHIKGTTKDSKLTIDDFHKIKVIGKGGFADKVYLGRKKDTG
jgi:hypothetical protein